jgi:hypothetical protein
MRGFGRHLSWGNGDNPCLSACAHQHGRPKLSVDIQEWVEEGMLKRMGRAVRVVGKGGFSEGQHSPLHAKSKIFSFSSGTRERQAEEARC